MKRSLFGLLALAVSALTFAFTPAPEKAPSSMLYAFTASGAYLGSAPTFPMLKASICPGANIIFCAQVWTGINHLYQPHGSRMDDLMMP